MKSKMICPRLKKNVLSEDDSATEKLEISVKNLSQRIDVQEAKIDSVDDKLNKIITQQNESKELKIFVRVCCVSS